MREYLREELINRDAETLVVLSLRLKLQFETLQAQDNSLNLSIESKAQLLHDLDAKSVLVMKVMEERQNHSLALAQRLLLAQREVGDLDASLQVKRAELDQVASCLVNRQRELNYSPQRLSLSEEERSLMHLQRSEMEQKVSLQVLEERRMMISVMRCDMHAEVERQVETEKKSLLAALQSQHAILQEQIAKTSETKSIPAEPQTRGVEVETMGDHTWEVISQRKKEVRARLVEIQAAREEWSQAWSAIKQEPDEATRSSKRKALKKLKIALEDEITRANEEVGAVNAMRRHKASGGWRDQRGQSVEYEPSVVTSISACSSL